MNKESFNFQDWFNKRFEAEKANLQILKDKFALIKEQYNILVDELKDDSHYMVPFLNGLQGDMMAIKGHKALIELSLRYQSRDISIDSLSEIYNFENFGGRVIIMVHGLMNDESVWHSEPLHLVQRLGSALEKNNEASILYVRYNTGLHISENGRALSNLIQNLIKSKKTEIKELVLIAHSMGGLVSRSACYYCINQNQSWTMLLKKVYLIGVPNEGSYLARAAFNIEKFFKKLDPSEKESIARLLDIRSNGIKDLSFAYLVDEDWKNLSEENTKNIKATKVFPLPNVDYYLIAAAVSVKSKMKRILTFFGDGLVEESSALSSLFNTFSFESGSVSMKLFPDENHISLLESKEVLEFVRSSLGWRS